MTDTPTDAPGLSTTQAGVQIVQRMAQCGMAGADYERDSNDLFGLMSEFAMREIQADFPQATLEQATHEDNENTPMAEAFWAATSLFFRKVYQAAAAAA